jgi:hypothetical protein
MMLENHIQIPAREVSGRHIGMMPGELLPPVHRPYGGGVYLLKFIRHTPNDTELIFYADPNTGHRMFLKPDEMVSLRIPTTGEQMQQSQQEDDAKRRRMNRAREYNERLDGIANMRRKILKELGGER